MKRWTVGQSLSVVLVAVLVYATVGWVAGWAAPGALTGSVRTSGLVLANATPIADGGTVGSGDRISTKGASLATILTATQGRLEVRAGSDARLLGDRVELERGAVAASQLAVEVDEYTIRPQGGGWFAVAKRDGLLLVAAHRGSVLISSTASAPVQIGEGSYALQGGGQAEKDNKEKKQKSKKRKGGAAAGAASGGWTIGGLGHAASIALVVGIGAGVAATAAGLAGSLNEDSPSPSR